MPVSRKMCLCSDFRCCRCMVVWSFLITGYCCSVFSFAADRIRRGQSIRDGETIISAGLKFELGFFSPQGSNLRYVGIWYYRVNVQTVVWVANRERPISGNGGVLTIGDNNNLMVMQGDDQVVWSSNGDDEFASVALRNSTAVLMDTGNLVLLASEHSTSKLWQSFDHPTDTYLPDMKVYLNANDGEIRLLSSWRSATDPSPGKYLVIISLCGSPQVVIMEGQRRHWRSGHWNGLTFIGVPESRGDYLSWFRLANEGDGRVYFTYSLPNSSNLIKFQLNWTGVEREDMWIEEGKQWSVIQSHPVDECDMYNRCGPYGICNQQQKPRCTCMEGFVPKDSDQWSRGNWSGGCTRRRELHCANNFSIKDGEAGGFVQVNQVKLPDLVDFVGSQDFKACQEMCRRNCSCTAFASVSGINCMIWNGDLVDVRSFSDNGQDLYIRQARSELGDKNHVIKAIVIAAVTVGAFLICVSLWFLLQYGRKHHANLDSNEAPKIYSSGEFSIEPSELGQANATELGMFSFNSVVAATDNFSNANKLGQGGFGPVYKGILPGGQEIAVKRLSRKSGQGLQEFKNEIMLIAKLQHRNLVSLLGCCIEGEENILLYEYMPNKSLDSYLFDPHKKAQLEWSTRFSIIEGITRGLLYMHRDSRLRIIHRDLKASNILLDEEMNPKISDFGMARIFGGNQNEESTNRVVGTYGYMAPEYAMEGLVSLKSDVYSFGVLLLEIITGRRNTSFRSTDHKNVIAYAWDLWDKGRAMELLDPSISESCSREQVLRCIHVGMLCVQEMAAHRPNMSAVELMLESANESLPMPREPTFTSMRYNKDETMSNENQDVVSLNNVTISAILGR